MKQRTSHEVETRLSKGGKAHGTKLVLDWSNVTEEELQEMAARSAIINWQRIARDAGKVPGQETAKVRDMLDGKRPPRVISVERLAADAGKMKPEEVAELVKALNKLRRGSAKAEEPEAPKSETPAPEATTA